MNELVAVGRQGSGALVGWISRVANAPEWDLVAVSALSAAVRRTYVPILGNKAIWSPSPEARLVALRGLKRHITVPHSRLHVEKDARSWDVRFPGKPDPGTRFDDDFDWSTDHREYIGAVGRSCLKDEKAPPEVKQAAQDLLDAIKERERKEKEFLAKQTAPPEAKPAK